MIICTQQPWSFIGIALAFLLSFPAGAAAQSARGVVVDQTGSALPGATIDVVDGTNITATVVSNADGSFDLPDSVVGSSLTVKLSGFETAVVNRTDASRIVMRVAVTDAVTVTAPILSPSSPVQPLVGTTLTTAEIARLPNSRLHARESLPLLPSVIRGADGLIRIGGARPSEAPMLLDGFDVTDPATGQTSISVPFEAVNAVQALRDPVPVTYGGLMGAVFTVETRAGDEREIGVQGFVPRPRFQNPGFGRIEGIFPRAFFAGRNASARFRYVGAVEYGFERIAVPDVTRGNGPNIVEQTGSVFGRADIDISSRHHLTLHGLFFPSATDLQGLSVRRDAAAAPNVRSDDVFLGMTSRQTFRDATVLTIRLGGLSHHSEIRPRSEGPALLSPLGSHGNWFSSTTRNGVRYDAAVALERPLLTSWGRHDLTLAGSIQARRLRGSVSESSVVVVSEQGDMVRRVTFGPPAALAVRDWPYNAAVRDLWHVNDRLQVDMGVRLDGIGGYGVLPSARAGIRYALDPEGITVVKASGGSFVGSLPLAVPAFAGYPERTESLFDDAAGGRVSTRVFQPTVGGLRLPYAVAMTLQLERQLRPGLDAQVGFTRRRSARLATLDVPVDAGPLLVQSDGRSSYNEFQLAVRQQWGQHQQVFVSYVHATARGELNDFMTLFAGGDAPLLQPGGLSRLSADARHRWLAWGTVDTPFWGLVVSPVFEWRSGFPYSRVNSQHFYNGTPHGESFPAFMALDMIAYKTVKYKSRAADIGVQLFNLTNHRNPRDVYAVDGSSRYGTFTNSVGPIVRGFMTIKW